MNQSKLIELAATVKEWIREAEQDGMKFDPVRATIAALDSFGYIREKPERDAIIAEIEG